MKLSKVIVSLLLVMSLSLMSVVPAFAVVAKESDTYVWELIDEEWTCKDASGQPVRGWAKRLEYTYYLDKTGKMRTGWIKYLGDWYYLYKDSDKVFESYVGTLATDTWIDNYYVDKKGIMTKTR